jgi:hypothetical protein
MGYVRAVLASTSWDYDVVAPIIAAVLVTQLLELLLAGLPVDHALLLVRKQACAANAVFVENYSWSLIRYHALFAENHFFRAVAQLLLSSVRRTDCSKYRVKGRWNAVAALKFS